MGIPQVPAATSLALDAANACDGNYDQRGATRSYATSCDIGAVEVQAYDNVSQADGSPSDAAIPDWKNIYRWRWRAGFSK